MSGGVDSSVAAWLMREQGYRCEGTTMRLYRNADIGLSQFHTCCSQKDIDDASEILPWTSGTRSSESSSEHMSRAGHRIHALIVTGI